MNKLSISSREGEIALHKTIIIAVTMLFLVLSIVLSPDTALQASLHGVNIWWKYIFPGLLPFFILYELMLAFGFFHGINAWFAPIVRLALKLPHTAGTPILMSFISGFPASAEPVGKLVKDQQLSINEARRLIQYIHLPNPIFIVIIIGASLFQSPLLGYILLLTVWCSAIILMIIHSYVFAEKSISSIKTHQQKMYFIDAMQWAQQQDGRNFGRVLGESVYNSVQKLFVIGGLIIFASVLSSFINPVMNLLIPHFPFIQQFMLEHHLASFVITSWTILEQNMNIGLPILAACLSFSGISGLLQVTFYTYEQKLVQSLSFLKYRLAHALFSFILLYLILRIIPQHHLYEISKQVPAVWIENTAMSTTLYSNLWLPGVVLTITFILICFLLNSWKRVRNI